MYRGFFTGFDVSSINVFTNACGAFRHEQYEFSVYCLKSSARVWCLGVMKEETRAHEAIKKGWGGFIGPPFGRRRHKYVPDTIHFGDYGCHY